jgi:hypothetical protein
MDAFGTDTKVVSVLPRLKLMLHTGMKSSKKISRETYYTQSIFEIWDGE